MANAPLSVGTTSRHYGRLGLLALGVILQCAPAPALEVDAAAKSNMASSPKAKVFWLSGGVGDESMAEMHKVSAAYNVHLMLTGPAGNYLAGIPFSVSRRNGRITVSGVTEGPVLYLKLPSGRYQISVKIDGAWQIRRIQVSGLGTVTKLRFVAKGE